MKNSPNVIIHMPDMYERSNEKWKDRFFATGATMAQGLIRNLKWPGDKPRFGGPPATQLGQFGVYRYDEEATRRLREEMEKMDPQARWDANGKRNLGYPAIDKTFNKRLREVIIRLTGAD